MKLFNRTTPNSEEIKPSSIPISALSRVKLMLSWFTLALPLSFCSSHQPNLTLLDVWATVNLPCLKLFPLHGWLYMYLALLTSGNLVLRQTRRVVTFYCADMVFQMCSWAWAFSLSLCVFIALPLGQPSISIWLLWFSNYTASTGALNELIALWCLLGPSD